MINLKNVTVITVDGVNPDMSLKALQFCAYKIKFNSVKLVSFAEPKADLKEVQFIKINRLNTWYDYNDFIIRKLNDYILTDYCLLIQTDGFVINPQLWKDEFFQYDYIGAPWPDDEEWISLQPESLQIPYRKNISIGRSRVGNGGFTFRSKRLLELCSKAPFDVGNLPEDDYICMNHNDYFIDNGMKFAPAAIAADFSLENPVKEKPFDFSTCFGFHGKHLPEHKIYLKKLNDFDNSPLFLKLLRKIKNRL